MNEAQKTILNQMIDNQKKSIIINVAMENDMFATLEKWSYMGALKDGYLKCPCGEIITILSALAAYISCSNFFIASSVLLIFFRLSLPISGIKTGG